MEFTKEEIEKVKNDNPGKTLFKAKVRYLNDRKQEVTLDFIYAKPSVLDMEAHNKAQAKSSFTAQLNLLRSLIVYPSADDIVKALTDYPIVVANFVNEELVPFFGTVVETTSSQI